MTHTAATNPDIRFDMPLHEITHLAGGTEFALLSTAEYVGGICVKGAATYTRKQLDQLTDWIKQPYRSAQLLYMHAVRPVKTAR